MSFTLDPRRPLGDEVQRVARAHVARMNRALEHPQRLGIEESVHDVRKRAKKLRALTRLVRPALADLYRPTNRAFRNAARELSQARDAHVMLETLDSLTAGVVNGAMASDVAVARAELVARQRRIHASLGGDDRELAAARSSVTKGMDLVGGWRIDDHFDVIERGVVTTCERLGRAYRLCAREYTAEAFHEWRKRAKYHRYHLELLVGAYPAMIEPWVAEMRKLTDALGEDHDLAVFGAGVRSQPGLFGGDDTADSLVALAEDRSAELRARALALGSRLAVEDPACVAGRLRAWWGSGGDEADAAAGR